MKWQYESLRRLIGQRIETATMKELRAGVNNPGGKSNLAYTRLYFTLDNGQVLECINTGIVMTNHWPRGHSLHWMREAFADSFTAIVEIAADKDQPDGIRVSNYQSHAHE